jgi:hypothetical protein
MSFANNQVFGDDITVTYGSSVYPLGTERLVLGAQTGVGDQVWEFVYNSSGSDIVAYQLLRHATTAANGTVALAGAVNPSYLVGVTQFTLPGATTTSSTGQVLSGPYGWVLKRGVGTINVTAGYTQDQALVTSATNGSAASTATATTASFGYGLGVSSGGAGVAGTAQVYLGII